MAKARDERSKIALAGTLVVAVLVIFLVVLAIMILANGTDDPTYNQPKEANNNNQSTDKVPQEPSNPNVTGGSTGVGNPTSNDPNNAPIPSPAGGTDANNVPAQGTQY